MFIVVRITGLFSSCLFEGEFEWVLGDIIVWKRFCVVIEEVDRVLNVSRKLVLLVSKVGKKKTSFRGSFLNS